MPWRCHRDIVAACIAEKQRLDLFEGLVHFVPSGTTSEIPYAPFDSEPAFNAIYTRYDSDLRKTL